MAAAARPTARRWWIAEAIPPSPGGRSLCSAMEEGGVCARRRYTLSRWPHSANWVNSSAGRPLRSPPRGSPPAAAAWGCGSRSRSPPGPPGGPGPGWLQICLSLVSRASTWPWREGGAGDRLEAVVDRAGDRASPARRESPTHSRGSTFSGRSEMIERSVVATPQDERAARALRSRRELMSP